MASQEKSIPASANNNNLNTPPVPLARSTTLSHQGFSVPDPFAPRHRPGASIAHALLATAFFRCWHLLLFFAGWSTLITVLNHQGHKLYMQPTLLTVVGTVLGFVISYRTTSSFERYNEGRRYWSQIVLASRTFTRAVWFHIPDPPATDQVTAEEMKARAVVEKKTVINLVEAFAVAVKHYLRGEDGIYYQDLYYLVKFLPAYALPAGIPQHNQDELNDDTLPRQVNLERRWTVHSSLSDRANELHQRAQRRAISSETSLPLPVTTTSIQSRLSPGPISTLTMTVSRPEPIKKMDLTQPPSPGLSKRLPSNPLQRITSSGEKAVLTKEEEAHLMPAHMPPKYHYFDIFPFSLLMRAWTRQGKEVKGKKAARLRAKMKGRVVSHNLPLEISLYLGSYVAAIQNRKAADVPTINSLHLSLNQLVDSLTGLERILTTPIPFSYSFHLWVVTVIYCLALIWPTVQWVTIPATIIASFMFFGFLVAGEEIENPFGYDKNDLNMDHYTGNIIRNELRAITSSAPPDPAKWAFSPENNVLFASRIDADERVTPEEWVKRGYPQMQTALGRI